MTGTTDGERVGREMTSDIWADSQKAGTSLRDRFDTARAALAQADPFYESESFWEGFLAGGLDEGQVAKVEGMLKAYKDRDGKAQSRAPGADDAVGQLLAEYACGVIGTVQDLADAAEALVKEMENDALFDAVQRFRRFQAEDHELAGRGDWDEAETALIRGIEMARSGDAYERE